MTILDLAKKHEEYIISTRRHIHENPELSGVEENTVDLVAQSLSDMGIEYVNIKQGGILARINGKTDNGKAIMLRADLDALMIDESDENLKGKKTCVSKHKGIMHACGHDGHTAMLLGAAKILVDKKNEFDGSVLLCFERGEEDVGGCEKIFEYIDKNGIKIDSVFAIHLYASAPSGKMIINDGAMMAGNMSLSVELKGRGGHGSRPDEANSPIDCFVAIYQRLQSLRLTRVSPFKTCTYSIGHLQSGTQSNVIPESLTFKGMIRYFDKSLGETVPKEIKSAVDGIASAYGCDAHCRINKIHPSVINTEHLAIMARNAISKELGEDMVCTAEPWMASETFSHYLEKWQGVMAFLGVKDEELGMGAPNHNPQFDLDESILKNGSTGAVAYALAFLNS